MIQRLDELELALLTSDEARAYARAWKDYYEKPVLEELRNSALFKEARALAQRYCAHGPWELMFLNGRWCHNCGLTVYD